MWLPQQLLALALLPLLVLGQSSNTASVSQSGGTSATNSGNATTTAPPVFYTSTITDFSISGTANVPITTRTVTGVSQPAASPTHTTTKKVTPTAPAPTNVNPGGGGVDGVKPLPGNTAAGGIYGPDDGYISAAGSVTVSLGAVGLGILLVAYELI